MASKFLFGKKLFGFIYGDESVEDGSREATLGAMAEQWLGNVRLHIKESSYVKYHNLVRNHITPDLGEVPLTAFTTELAENFIENKLKYGRLKGDGGLSEKTVRDILAVLKEIHSFAVCQGYGTPCHLELVKIRARTAEVCVLEKQEQQKLESVLFADRDPIKTGILLSLYMGLRLGEVCALKREHINLETGVLQIRGTMQRIQNLNTENGKKTKVIVTEPKSMASIRDIPIPEFLMERLQAIERLPEQAYILTGTTQQYIEPRTMENIFRAYLKQYRIKTINYHALRHTFATRCIEMGFDVKSLSEILGHTNVNITLNRYVHSSMEQKRKHMEKLEVLNVKPLSRVFRKDARMS